MAAYAAVISLTNTIDRLLNHNRISISPEQNQEILSLLEYVTYLQAFLENFPDKSNSLEGRMRDLAQEAEDIIEYFMLDQVSFLPGCQTKVNKILLEKKKEYECKDSAGGFEDLVTELKDSLCGEPPELEEYLKEYEENQGADSPVALATSSTAPPILKDSTGGWFRRFIHSRRRNNKQKEHADYMDGFEDLVPELKDSLCGEPPELEEYLKEYEENQGADSPVALATSSTAPPILKDSTGGWFRRFIHSRRRNNKQKEHADYMDGFEDLVPELKDSLCGEPPELEEYLKEYEENQGADSPVALATSSTAPPILKYSTGGWFRRFIHSQRRNNKQKEHADSFICKVTMVSSKEIATSIYSMEYEHYVYSPVTLAISSTAPRIRKDSTGGKDSMGGWFRRFIHSRRRNNKHKEHADSFIRTDYMGGFENSFIRKHYKCGFEDLVIELKDHLLCGETSKLQFIPIFGPPGIGKTTLARYLYHDPLIMKHFEIRVWVNAFLHDSQNGILSSILKSLEEYTKAVKGQSYDVKVSQMQKILIEKRYLIVLDNFCSEWGHDDVRKAFPDNHNGSRVMLISRHYKMRYEDLWKYEEPPSKLYEMVLLNEDESWDLLKRKVFGDEECPSELENIGKEIARCCKGWSPALVTIAENLSATKRTCASWKEWAEEYRDESICYQHELQLGKVLEEIGLIAGEAREIKYSSSSSERKSVQRGDTSFAALISSSSADLIINNSNTMQLSAAASSSGKVMSMKKNNIKQEMVQLDDSCSNNVVERGAASSATLSIHKDVMVGFEDYVLDLQNRLCGEPSKKLQVIPICGMGGIGKTTLARNLYHDPLIVSRFDVHVWVTISQDYSAQRILLSLMESLKEFNTDKLRKLSDDEKVHKILFGRRYLVVLDDVWSSEAWDVVRRVFPDDGNGSRVMLTTRLSDVASYPDPSSKLFEMSLWNEDESWNLLKKNVFGDEDCPSELQDIGKKIARSCKGLPLAIVVIAGLLSTTKGSLDSWKVIAKNVKSAEHDQIEEILYLSYVHLPQYLRPCFLYMGSFPEDHHIDVLKLIRLWIAEGFIKSPTNSDSFEKVAEECLEELVKRNLVLVTKRKWDGRIEICSLHDLMRNLCIRKSHESKFFLNMMDRHIGKESFIEKVRNQRRVSVDSSNMKIFSSLHGSTIRSIKCSGHHHLLDSEIPYSLESVRLLRVLDGEHLFHLDELFHLRYLTFQFREGLLLWLSRLQNLQTLVIHDDYNRPIELKWCMSSQLRHVYCDRGAIEFEDPKETDCPLESLQTLSYVSLSTCRETIFKMIPNLKKLGINCSKGLFKDGGVRLVDLEHLHRLEDLEIRARTRVEYYYYKVTLPRMLKKLILRDWDLPWYDNIVFSSSPNLQVLELIGCACVGGTWETTEGEFQVLEVLKISKSRFENWVTESSHFPRLKLLQLHDCEKLNGIPNDIGDIPTLQLIEVTGYARKSLIDSVELIREEQEDMGNDTLQVVCTDSFDYYRRRFW